MRCITGDEVIALDDLQHFKNGCGGRILNICLFFVAKLRELFFFFCFFSKIKYFFMHTLLDTARLKQNISAFILFYNSEIGYCLLPSTFIAW